MTTRFFAENASRFVIGEWREERERDITDLTKRLHYYHYFEMAQVSPPVPLTLCLVSNERNERRPLWSRKRSRVGLFLSHSNHSLTDNSDTERELRERRRENDTSESLQGGRKSVSTREK